MSFSSFKIPCVILSGGKSSRMGEDKSLLPFSKSDTLIQYQYKKLKPYFPKLFISSKIDKFDFLNDKKEIILDENKDVYSPILALYTILKEHKKVFIIPVDTPFVKIESIEKLINQSDDFDITIAKTIFKTHNLCGVYSNNILNFIEKMIDEDIHKINYLIKNCKHQEIDFANEDEFLNLNEKSDYEKAVNLII